MKDAWNSDRRCEAPEGGAMKDAWNSDRRCEAPEGGAMEDAFPASLSRIKPCARNDFDTSEP
jgi:hypothetical protein